MPNSCRTIVKKCLHKGAINQKEYEKLMRKLDLIDINGHKMPIAVLCKGETMQKKYIDKNDLLNGIYSENPKDVMKYIAVFPTADVVSRELYDQVKFERDVLQEIVDNSLQADVSKSREGIRNDNGTYFYNVCQSWIDGERKRREDVKIH